MKNRVAAVWAMALLVFPLFLCASNSGDAAIRAWIRNTLATDLTSMKSQDILSSETCIITVSETAGWKRGASLSWGAYSVMIQFPVAANQETQFRAKQNDLKAALDLKARDGRFTGNGVWQGAMYTREPNTGSVIIVSKDAFDQAMPTGIPDPRNTGNSATNSPGQPPLKEKIIVKTIPVYANLQVESFSLVMISTDGRRAVAPGKKAVAEIYGIFKSNLRNARIQLQFSLRDSSQQGRTDIIVSRVWPIENSAVRDHPEKGSLLQVYPEKPFTARIEFDAGETFQKKDKLFLSMPIIINGNSNTPLIVEIPIVEGFNLVYILLLVAIVVAGIIAVYSYMKSKGVNYAKLRCELSIMSGKDSGRAIPLDGDAIVIGRMPETVNGIKVQSEKASRRHAILTRTNRGYVLADAGSTNGTMHNEHKLLQGQSVLMVDGDRINIGGIQFVYHLSKR